MQFSSVYQQRSAEKILAKIQSTDVELNNYRHPESVKLTNYPIPGPKFTKILRDLKKL